MGVALARAELRSAWSGLGPVYVTPCGTELTKPRSGLCLASSGLGPDYATLCGNGPKPLRAGLCLAPSASEPAYVPLCGNAPTSARAGLCLAPSGPALSHPTPCCTQPTTARAGLRLAPPGPGRMRRGAAGGSLSRSQMLSGSVDEGWIRSRYPACCSLITVNDISYQLQNAQTSFIVENTMESGES